MTDPGTPTAGPREFWNDMYASEAYRYGVEPNAWLAECADRIVPGGRVLCVGDGEGRNGTWLAGGGFDVVTIDASDRGVEKSRLLAARRGVTVDARQGMFPRDLGEPAGSFDAVILTYIHVPQPARASFHRACIDQVATGGFVILEAFTPDQIGRTSGGPQTADRLFTMEQLQQDFAALELLVLRETEVRLTEGAGHAGLGAVVRMLGRRP